MALKWPWSKQPAKQLLKAQFWACVFLTHDDFEAFIEEDDDFYSIENEEAENPIPLSRFAGSQGETSYDHDFMEVGQVGSSDDPKIAISASYSEFWAEEFMRRARDAGIEPTHFIMVGIDRPPNAREYRQFGNPVSVEGEGYSLIYLGEIEHEDYP